jgi:23S rRNA (uracil1939-C5)-methyltransferase
MLIDLEIETLTLGSRGLGRHQGKAVFVPGTAPGDRVRCRIVRSRSQFDEAEPVELLSPSALRRLPPCPVFGECGGCQWQHLPYDVQVRWKEQLFHDLLLRQGVATAVALRPIVPAPAEWGYRNRVQFKCRQTRHGLVTGFYRQASHFVTDTPNCLLVEPAIQQVYDFLRKILPESPQPQALPQFDIACSHDRHVSVLFHLLPEAPDALCRWLSQAAAQGGFAAAVQIGRKESIRTLAGNPGLSVMIDDPPLSIQVAAGGFAQVNPDQNRRLVDAVVTAAGLTGCERVLDLYCGAGNFTLPLARRAGSVVGVEEYPPAIDDARGNAARNAVANATFLVEPAEGAALRHGAFDLVLLDPPRTGAYPVMRDLQRLQPSRILYVSCDPATLARDLQPLVHNGYAVVAAQPFDLFPQTWHIESLTVLERVG